MNAPRLLIDLGKIHDNARILVARLARRRISVTGVMKGTLGSPAVGEALIEAGVETLGDARVENIIRLRRAGVSATMALIRSPMMSQVEETVAHVDYSYNTELEVIRRLSSAARRARRTHGVVLMVELGDLREGIMPGELDHAVYQTLRLPNIELMGVGTNLACLNGIAPDAEKMRELSALVETVRAKYGITFELVSGGNSASLGWALSGAATGSINGLRLGEALLLGREPLRREPIEGLHTDAIRLVAEVIESKMKPSMPWGELGQNAFGARPLVADRGPMLRSILALGRQDVDPEGLRSPDGIEIIGASSDHLVMVSPGRTLAVGGEVSFQVNYSALLRAMTSPFVTKVFTRGKGGLLFADFADAARVS